MEMEKLGFKNRGLKYGGEVDGLAEIKKTIMPAMIIECFFLNSKADVDLYRRIGPSAVAGAIYRGIKKGTGTYSEEAVKELSRTCDNCRNFQPLV